MTTMSTTEIACEKCLHPLIPSGPASQAQGISTHGGFFITKCKHLYHQSCIRELFNTPTSANSQEPHSFICQRQNCATVVKHNEIFTIAPTLQTRTIHFAGLTMPDENLQRNLKIEPQAPSYTNSVTRTSKPTAKHPMKTTTKHLSKTAVNQIQMPKTTTSQIPKPKSTTSQNTSSKAPSQTTKCTQPLKMLIILANELDAKLRESERKNPASIARSYSRAKKPAKHGPIEQTRQRHIRFQKRFKIDSEILEPFYPLNSYPFQYTAAGIQSSDDGVQKIAILAKDVLMMGDGLIYGMVQLISTAIPFEFDLHPALYGRDFDILDLAVALDFSFPKLPPRIMLSIGNWDVFDFIRSQPQKFHDKFRKLLQSFESRQVKELYLIPPIRYTNRDSSSAFAYVVFLFKADGGNTFGGKTIVLDPPSSFKYPIVDKDGPMFELELFEPFVRYIRERFIPQAAENHSDDEVM